MDQQQRLAIDGGESDQTFAHPAFDRIGKLGDIVGRAFDGVGEFVEQLEQLHGNAVSPPS